MNIKKHLPRSKGQTVVEFALVLPVLLLVVIGLIEVGRLIFIYGSVVTASRQAVRYGSATGFNTSNIRKYLDCDGIEAEAERMGFLLPISSVDILYTREGIGTIADCDSSTSAPVPATGLIENGDRIEITTTSIYAPILSFIPLGPFDITTSSKRTIFIGIIIMSTPGPALPQPSMTIKQEAYESDGTTPKTGYTGPGDVVVYKYIIENTSDTYTLSTLEITDENSAQICTSGSLAPLATLECFSSPYTITAADEALIDGENKVTKKSYGAAYYNGVPLFKSTGVVLTFIEVPALEIAIVADPSYTASTSGSIDFDFTITNTGNVALSTFSLASQSLTTFNDCTAIAGSLNPGDTALCTSTYNIDAADIDASGLITYTATMQAVYDVQTPVSPAASAEVNTRPISLSLPIITPNPYEKTPYKEISQVTYTFQARNNTSDILSGASLDLEIRDADKNLLTSPNIICGTGTLDPDIPVTCVGSYAIQQTDLNNGKIYIANATASATHPTDGSLISNTVADLASGKEIVVTATPKPKLILTTVIETIDGTLPGTVLTSGETVPTGTTQLKFSYSIYNDGNITLPTGTTYEILVDGTNFCTGTTALGSELLPTSTASNQCIRTYTISADEFAAGQLNKDATVEMTSISWAGTTVSAPPSAEVPALVYTFAGPRFDVSMSALLSGNTVLTGGETIDTGSQIEFTYTFTNTGNADIDTDFIITDSENTINCSSAGTAEIPAAIPPGGSGSCSHLRTASSAGSFTNAVSAATANGLAANSLPASMTFTVQDPLVCTLSASLTTSGSQTSHTWTINNQSGTTVELSSLTVTWSFQKLESVTVNGTSVFSGSTSSSPRLISALTNTLTEGNNLVVLTFSQGNTAPSVSASFANDPLCTGYTVP